METPGAPEVARIPSVIVPVCVVKGVSAPPGVDENLWVEVTPCVSGVVASVPGCMLPTTPCMSEQPVCVSEAPCVRGTTCAQETARVCEQPCGSEARCVSETPRVSAPRV